MQKKVLNLRSDFKEAKETCKRLYHKFTAIIGSGHTRIPPQQHVRQRRDQQFEALDEYIFDLKLLQDGDTMLRGNLHLGVNSDFFLLQMFQMSDFISLAGNLVSWQSTGGVNSTLAAHTFAMPYVTIRLSASIGHI